MDEQTIVTAERLRDELADLKSVLRKKYKPTAQVSSDKLRQQAASLAERWLVGVGADDEVNLALSDARLADLNVHFQRILTFSEHATIRSRYDKELGRILHNYATEIVLPLKQMRGKTVANIDKRDRSPAVGNSVFVGQSFDASDAYVNNCIGETLGALGLTVVTGDRPRADKISEKVKTLIEQQSIFVGIFTKRDKIARKSEWTTSTWVIDEKAYAVGLQKPLILLKEQGVASIGGIQGEYEYI